MNQKKVITISRQYGSGGRRIGKLLANELNIPFYDRELISLAAGESGIAEEFFENAEQSRSASTFSSVLGGKYEPPLSDKVYFAQCDAIRSLAEKGPCIIVGRCADHVLQNRKDVLNVFIYADAALRQKRAVEDYGDAAAKISEKVKFIDKKRSTYYEYYSDQKYGRCENYHLCIDSGAVGVEGAAKIILTAYLADAKLCDAL